MDDKVYFYDTKQYTYDKKLIDDAIDGLFGLMKLDEKNKHTDDWNPLSKYISPGDKVLIKPNMVMDYNRSGEGTECLYTQAEVVDAVLRYVCRALDGKGSIIVGDAPMQECNFDNLISQSGYQSVIDKYQTQGIDIKLIDFRELTTDVINGIRHQKINNKASGMVIDLGIESEFSQFSDEKLDRLRITNYDPQRLKTHHTSGKHEYYVSKYVLDADVIINMPKPKTHRKAGVTIAMKNLVGINARKEYLPHHTLGSPEVGGDQSKRDNVLIRLSNKCYDRKNYHEGKSDYRRAWIYKLVGGGIKFFYSRARGDSLEGSWSGNNTICRTIIDLNKILLYCDSKGNLQEDIQRRILNIADMIISGEKEGPVAPSPKNVGYLVAGENSLTFDIAVATMMGADVARIPTIQMAINTVVKGKDLFGNIRDAEVVSNNILIDTLNASQIKEDDKWDFVPTSGWRDVFHITNDRS